MNSESLEFKGTYSFFQNGELIAASDNLITEPGRKLIMRYLAGLVSTIGGSIAVGLGTTTATSDDSRLTYEFDRAIVTLSSVDFINDRIVFKGTLGQGLVGTIYEAGLFSEPYADSGRGYDSKTIFAFGNAQDEPWAGGSYSNTYTRLSENSLRVTSSSSSSSTANLPSVNLDFSGYSNTDVFRLAFKPVNSNVSNIKIRFFDTDVSSYYEATVTPSGTNYQIVDITKSSFTRVGTTVDWNDIKSASVIVTATSGGTGTVDFDGLRIESLDTLDKTNILVSRTVLGVPLVKDDVVPMEVEYSVKVVLA